MVQTLDVVLHALLRLPRPGGPVTAVKDKLGSPGGPGLQCHCPPRRARQSRAACRVWSACTRCTPETCTCVLGKKCHPRCRTTQTANTPDVPPVLTLHVGTERGGERRDQEQRVQGPQNSPRHLQASREEKECQRCPSLVQHGRGLSPTSGASVAARGAPPSRAA